jgi:hypothetical protein
MIKRNSKILYNKYSRKKTITPQQRCATVAISRCPKFINNFKFHALGYEIVLGECEGKFFVNLECAAHSKSFSSIDLDFPFPNALTVNLIERPMVITPVDKFIAYMLRIGDKGNIAWANTIQNYKQTYSEAYAKCRKDMHKDNTGSSNYIINTESAWQELIKNKNAMWITTIYSPHGKKMKSFTIENKFLETLGYSRDSFCSKVLREGFPKMFLTDRAYFELSQLSPLLFEEYHLLNYHRGEIVKKCQLYNSQDQLVNAMQSFQTFIMQTNNEEELEARFLFTYDVSDDTIPESTTEMLNSMYTEDSLSIQQKQSIFMTKFYDKYGGDLKDSSRCRVRELKNLDQEDELKKPVNS